MTPNHPVIVHVSQRQKDKILASLPPEEARVEGTTGAFMVLRLSCVLFVPWPELNAGPRPIYEPTITFTE